MNAELMIEEGQVVVIGADLGDAGEWLQMAPIPVIIEWATDCPAYDTDEMCVPIHAVQPMRGYEQGSHYLAHGTRCDCNWWPVARLAESSTPQKEAR